MLSPSLTTLHQEIDKKQQNGSLTAVYQAENVALTGGDSALQSQAVLEPLNAGWPDVGGESEQEQEQHPGDDGSADETKAGWPEEGEGSYDHEGRGEGIEYWEYEDNSNDEGAPWDKEGQSLTDNELWSKPMDDGNEWSQRQVPDTEDPDRVRDPWTVSFRTCFYFLHWMRILLERCCETYVAKHLTDLTNKLKSWENWDQNHLRQIRWKDSGAVELWEYTKLFKYYEWDLREEPYNLKDISRVRQGAEKVRHAAVHAGQLIGMKQLQDAMDLPAILGDLSLTNQLQELFSRVESVSPPVAESEAKEAFWATLFPSDGLPVTTNQLLFRMQLITNRALFEHRKRTNPEYIRSTGSVTFEEIDPKHYHWGRKSVDPSRAVDVRNMATHRNTSDEDEIRKLVQGAIALVLDCGDAVQAVETEIYAEQYFTKTARAEVLERLRGVYLDDDPALFEEGRIMKRKEAILQLLREADAGIAPGRVIDYVPQDDASDEAPTQLFANVDPSLGAWPPLRNPFEKQEAFVPFSRHSIANTPPKEPDWPNSMHEELRKKATPIPSPAPPPRSESEQRLHEQIEQYYQDEQARLDELAHQRNMDNLVSRIGELRFSDDVKEDAEEEENEESESFESYLASFEEQNDDRGNPALDTGVVDQGEEHDGLLDRITIGNCCS